MSSPSFPLVATTVSVQLPVQSMWKPAQELLMTPGRRLVPANVTERRILRMGSEVRRADMGRSANAARFSSDMRGAYHSFRFCDPLRNLLAWSEDLTQTAWTLSGGLAVTLFAIRWRGGTRGARS